MLNVVCVFCTLLSHSGIKGKVSGKLGKKMPKWWLPGELEFSSFCSILTSDFEHTIR